MPSRSPFMHETRVCLLVVFARWVRRKRNGRNDGCLPAEDQKTLRHELHSTKLYCRGSESRHCTELLQETVFRRLGKYPDCLRFLFRRLHSLLSGILLEREIGNLVRKFPCRFDGAELGEDDADPVVLLQDFRDSTSASYVYLPTTSRMSGSI